MSLESGSRLLLFTDGLVDAVNSKGEEFGEDRLVALAAQNRRKSAEDFKSSILGEVMTHCDHQLQDDATLLVIALD